MPLTLRRELMYDAYCCYPVSENAVTVATGWGEGAITGLQLEYLYGPEPEVSGE